MFWFYMNRGQWFANPKKIFLTILNLIILGIAFAIVSLLYTYPSLLQLTP